MENNQFLNNLVAYKFVEPIWEHLSNVILMLGITLALYCE